MPPHIHTDAYRLTLRRHAYLKERKKWLTNYIKVGDQADSKLFHPLLSSRALPHSSFLAYEQRLRALFTLKPKKGSGLNSSVYKQQSAQLHSAKTFSVHVKQG